MCVLGKERTGFNYAYAGLLLELTAANLLAFYFDQFSTIFFALTQLILLVAIVRYQQRFLTSRSLFLFRRESSGDGCLSSAAGILHCLDGQFVQASCLPI